MISSVQAAPIVKVAIEPALPSDLPRLVGVAAFLHVWICHRFQHNTMNKFWLNSAGKGYRTKTLLDSV
jgi:hypothetical protein